MFSHGPSCLKGPLSRAHQRWTSPVVDATETNPRRDQDVPSRQDLVERIRAAIAAGAYETPENWQIALDRLLRRLDAE
jgi:anti-sigma28 factor (negative regulator of flagellin synthesis)